MAGGQVATWPVTGEVQPPSPEAAHLLRGYGIGAWPAGPAARRASIRP